jgi:hypothetical protein
MKIEGDDLVMSSGRRFYANCGIIGLSDRLTVTEGYDGAVPAWEDGWGGAVMTTEERREMADYMIALWTKFRDAGGPIEGA